MVPTLVESSYYLIYLFANFFENDYYDEHKGRILIYVEDTFINLVTKYCIITIALP